MDLRDPGGSKRARLRWSFTGSANHAIPRGLEELPGKANYFLGNDPKKWRTNVPTYAKVKILDLYPGIDLVYYGSQRQLEYDLIVAPGTDPDCIQLAFEGADRMEANGQGGLVLHTGTGQVVLRKPVIYQDAGGGIRREVAGGYVVRGRGRVGFHVEEYDRERPLVVDPVLVYSAYFSGSGLLDESMAVAVDTAGNAYVTGQTYSANFPVANPFQPRPGESGPLEVKDAFVLKLNASGSALIYATYLGGSGRDFGLAIAVDAAGNAYVTGYTASTNFPVTTAVQARNAGGHDAFVTKLNPAGSGLVYSTYLGGADADSGVGIAADSSGQAYVTGITYSSAFPLANALQRARAGPSDAFITKLDAAGSAIVYSTYLGGSGNDIANTIAVDGAGAAYIAGMTTSTDFPVAAPLQSSAGGRTDAFVAKLNPAGSALVYSTYLGGAQDDGASGIAIDSSGAAHVAGTTNSVNFPTVKAVQPAGAGKRDGFVAKLNPSGASLVHSTFLGGSEDDTVAAIAVDAGGNAMVAGTTSSFDFPVANPLQANMGGSLVWKSGDGGVHWAPSGEGLKASAVNCLLVDPGTPTIAYAGTSHGVFKTVNGGATWMPMTKGLTSLNVSGLASGPGEAGAIYAATGAGVFRSAASGLEWAATGMTAPAVLVAADPLEPATLYAGTNSGILKSTDAGQSWSMVLARNGVLSFTVDPSAPAMLYAVAAGALFRSTDAGGSWTSIPPPRLIAIGETWFIVVDPRDSATLYFAGSSGMYKSTNGGAAWTPATTGPGGLSTTSITALVIDKGSPSTLYAATHSAGGAFGPGGIYKSTDGGTNWVPMTLDVLSLTALAVESGSMYAGAFRGSDAFLTRLKADGTALLHSTYLGGQDAEGAFGLAADSAGNAYVAGSTSSTDFPMTGPIFAGKGVVIDGFLAKVSEAALATPLLYNVSAASLSRSGSLAPDSMASAFGTGLAPALRSATALPLPSEIAGTSVRVKDSAGVERLAPLIAVSPGQVNYIVPEGTASGIATISVASSGRVVAAGMVRIEPVAPALFAANADGRGAPAAVAVRVGADGAQTPVPVFQCGDLPGSCVPAPIDLASNTVVLSLFGTGIRGRTALSAVTVIVYSPRAAYNLRPLYAGPQAEYPALDQVNVELPRALMGRGDVEIQVMADRVFSNRLRMAIK